MLHGTWGSKESVDCKDAPLRQVFKAIVQAKHRERIPGVRRVGSWKHGVEKEKKGFFSFT